MYFLRALNYHNLVKYYGGVPLRLEPITDPADAANLPRSPVAEVYAQIIADLTEAETRLVNTIDPDNHATLGAAKALLARVYLYQGNYALAQAKSQEVVDLGYSLAPDYTDLWEQRRGGHSGEHLPGDLQPDTVNLLGYYWLSDVLNTERGPF